jgi:serine/threonine protein kinase
LPPIHPAGTLQMLEGLTFVQAVVWLAARLADGLAHAHERGIVHRDLKPANILLTEEGQPMLLDFNLSEDTKLRGGTPAALGGGTLPYMAPEQLDALQGGKGPVDARSDLYALGVILYELLTGRHPFPTHQRPPHQVLSRMIAERLQASPRLRRWSPAVSPAVESIVRHCLEPDPARRYQSAAELREDLERQRNHLPLRYAPEPSHRERLHKWVSRHPRRAVGSFLVLILVGLIASIINLHGVLVRRQALELLWESRRLAAQSKARPAARASGIKAIAYEFSVTANKTDRHWRSFVGAHCHFCHTAEELRQADARAATHR